MQSTDMVRKENDVNYNSDNVILFNLEKRKIRKILFELNRFSEFSDGAHILRRNQTGIHR